MSQYLSTHKTDHTPVTTLDCPHCPRVITSTQGETGAYHALRGHVKKFHPEHFQPLPRGGRHDHAPAEFVQYPKTSTPPPEPEPAPDEPPRATLPCPYCEKVLSSPRAYLLQKILKGHMRREHPDQLLAEIAARREAWLTAAPEPLTEAEVISAYYSNALLRSRHPVPPVVCVPERWHVERVFVKVTNTGHVLAYRGRLGASEAWRVGEG